MRIGVAGASGYLGAELLRLLAGHPSLEVAVAQADTSAGIQVATLYPNLAPEYRDLVFSPLDPAGLHGLDAVFIALPSGRSQDLVPALARSVPLVVDLGGDFRLRDPSLYPVWYGFEHRAPELLGRFVYGLPELFRHELAGAPLVAAPGCYVTAATLALAPLVKEGLIEPTGVIVDEAARTSDPSIFAIGDVTLRPMPLYNRMFRPESVPSALEQAKQAACAIAGRPPPPHEVPWNWSDQYDLKMQLAGLPFDVDEVLVRGDPANAHFAVFHLHQGMIQAVEAVNAPAEFMGGRQLIGSRRVIARERLADPSISMKEVAA